MTPGVLPVPIIAIAVLLRDGLGLLALVALFMIAVNTSERTTPRWLRRRGYPPPLYLETKEGRRRLQQLIRKRPRQNPDDEPPSE
jgi:hypothetical protein